MVQMLPDPATGIPWYRPVVIERTELEQWLEYHDPATGKPWYFHSGTGEATWYHPVVI